MFHPVEQPMRRGWVGRVDGEHVVQLAAQTLQSFFTGGGAAREHAVYPLAEVRLLAPVLHPPSIRIFESRTTFAFANPAAILGPASAPGRADNACNSLLQSGLVLLPRLAGVVGVDGALGGFTVLAEWRDPARTPPKDRDFALGLGPVVVTADELNPEGLEAVVRADGREVAGGRLQRFDWGAARDLAADGTRLYPGDLLAGPALEAVTVSKAARVEIEVAGIGVLDQVVVA